MKFSRRGTLAALIGVALLAAACGSDDSEDSAATTSTTAGAAGQSTTTAAATTGGTAAKAPASMEEWEALWAKERDAIVKRIKDNKWGSRPTARPCWAPRASRWTWRSARPAGATPRASATPTSRSAATRRSRARWPTPATSTRAPAVLFDYYSATGLLQGLLGQEPQDHVGLQGRRLRPGAIHPGGRRVPGLRQGRRHLGARFAERHEDLRQDQPALRRPPVRGDRPPRLGGPGQPPVDHRHPLRLQHRGRALGQLHRHALRRAEGR